MRIFSTTNLIVGICLKPSTFSAIEEEMEGRTSMLPEIMDRLVKTGQIAKTPAGLFETTREGADHLWNMINSRLVDTIHQRISTAARSVGMRLDDKTRRGRKSQDRPDHTDDIIARELLDIYFAAAGWCHGNAWLTEQMWESHTTLTCREHGFDFYEAYNTHARICAELLPGKLFRLLKCKDPELKRSESLFLRSNVFPGASSTRIVKERVADILAAGSNSTLCGRRKQPHKN